MMKHPFLLGALGYPTLELLYRGRTHYSMALAGGCATVLANRIRRMQIPRPARAVLCGTVITEIEGVCGYIWNQDYHVWDYRQMPLNWRGQICVPFSLLWCVLGGAAMEIMNQAEKHGVG